VPVVGDPAQAAYTVAQLRTNLESGINTIATQYLPVPPPSITCSRRMSTLLLAKRYLQRDAAGPHRSLSMAARQRRNRRRNQ